MVISELLPGYRLDEGVLVRENDGRVIANFFLVPTKAYCYKGETLPSFCDIAVVRDGQSIPFKNRMKLSELTSAWWKALHPPPGCYYGLEVKSPYRPIETLFQMRLGKLEPVSIFQPAMLGWDMLPTGEHVYVTGGGALGTNGYLLEDQVWIPNELQQYRLETMPEASESESAQYFWKLYRMIPGITDILLANVLAAILFPCFKEAGIESRFPVILEGPSEAKKTTLACLTGCLFNRKGSPRGCIATLTSTNRALEKRGIELRHALVVYDDLFPDGGAALEQKAMELVRDIANQVPRQSRSGKVLDGSVMECGAVITAEAFPNCGRSTRTRCLRLPLREPVRNDTLLPLQEQPELLGNVFQTFIMQIAGDFEGTTRQIAKDFREYRQSRARSTSAESERLCEIGFVLYTALKMYLWQEYEPSSSKVQDELNRFQACVMQRIRWQLSPQAAPGRGWMISATAELVKRWPKEFLWRPGYVCITPGKLCCLLQKRYGDKTINVHEIIGQLRGEQLLAIDRSGAATKKIKGYGRCLHINKQKLLR